MRYSNSYIFVFSKISNNTELVDAALKKESLAGLQDLNTYLAYADRCQEIVNDLNLTIDHYRGLGYVVCGYGAAAKGNTLLNFGNIDLDFIIDDNPLKQGLFTPGTNIPVVGIDVLDECQDLNVAFVPLAWNFFTEIKSRIKEKRNKEGDVFVKYFPTITIE